MPERRGHSLLHIIYLYTYVKHTTGSTGGIHLCSALARKGEAEFTVSGPRTEELNGTYFLQWDMDFTYICTYALCREVILNCMA